MGGIKSLGLVLALLSSFLLMLVPFNGVVSSSSVTYYEDFDDDFSGSYASESWGFRTHNLTTATFKVSSDAGKCYSSPNAFKISPSYTYTSLGYFDFLSSFTELSFKIYFTTATGSSKYIVIPSLNSSSNSSWNTDIIDFYQQATSVIYVRYDGVLFAVLSSLIWYNMTIQFNSSSECYIKISDALGIIGDVELGGSFDSNLVTRLFFKSGTDSTVSTVYIDDLVLTVDTGGSSSGCSDFSGFDDIYHVPGNDVASVVPYGYVEFCSRSVLNARLEGFDWIVGGLLGSITYDLSDYSLYINGMYVGNPQCSYVFSTPFVALSWDLDAYDYTITDAPVFELVVPVDTYFPTHTYVMGPPSNDAMFYYSSDSSYLDGVWNGEFQSGFNSPNWILYYSEFDDNATNPGYTNTIGLLSDTGQNLPVHPIYDLPFSYVFKTIFFDVYVDEVGVYELNVFDDDGSPVGFTQFYPKEMLTYHKTYGFTPYAVGNYTVSLTDGNGYFLNETFNVSFVDVPFAIWSFPNPSNYQSTITIGVYAGNPSKYVNYSIGGSWDVSNLNIYDNADLQLYIPGFDADGLYFVETYPGLSSGTYYFRLFGGNSTNLFPITGLYRHYIEGFSSSSYIRTSLTNNQGVVDQVFNVYGLYSGYIGSGVVTMNDEVLGSVSPGSFLFSDSFSEPGTYNYYLKVNYGGNWLVIDTVTVSIGSDTGELGYVDYSPVVILFLCVAFGFIAFAVGAGATGFLGVMFGSLMYFSLPGVPFGGVLPLSVAFIGGLVLVLVLFLSLRR